MKAINVGGIETYVHALIPTLLLKGLYPIVVQFANIDKVKIFDTYEVHGVNVADIRKFGDKAKKIFEYSLLQASADDIILYSTEDLIVRKIPNKTIAIQHGIYWDKPVIHESLKSKLIHFYTFWGRTHFADLVDAVICVDYNYVNWYRTIRRTINKKFSVIPNFSRIEEMPEKNYNEIKIIFARRFVEYRGTRIFAKAIKRLSEEFNHFQVYIAGDGPDEQWIKNELADLTNVRYIKYTSDESLAVHKDKTIAVVPTLGSEGTSLSLLEAMASGCAVVATNVGGMTNIVIDNYNGLMIGPTEDELYVALKKLLTDKALSMRLGTKAYETVKEGFSYDLWVKRWSQVIDRFL